MCRTRTPGGRPVAFLALLLQLALMVALPLAHARADTAEARRNVHLEAESGGLCLPHNDFDCQLCRLHPVADLTSGADVVSSIPSTHRTAELPAAASAEPGNAPYHGAFGPRAPPLA